MNIVIINGSSRKNGATAKILKEISNVLNTYSNMNIQLIHLSDIKMEFCQGCYSCYKTGTCFIQDDVEQIIELISKADGTIIGTPTYESNISGQLKVLADRGHFVFEQLLHQQYALTVTTFENYGGGVASKILNNLMTYSGATLSASIKKKILFNENPLDAVTKKKLEKEVRRFYLDIEKRKIHPFQWVKQKIIFEMGIKQFVYKKAAKYTGIFDGVFKHWENKQINFKHIE